MTLLPLGLRPRRPIAVRLRGGRSAGRSSVSVVDRSLSVVQGGAQIDRRAAERAVRDLLVARVRSRPTSTRTTPLGGSYRRSPSC